MSSRLEWVLSLQDKLSGPGARIERQLSSVRASLKTLDIEARQNKLASLTDPLKRQRLELQLQRDKLLLSKSALDKAGGASRKAGSDTGFFVRQLHDVLHIAQIVGGALERMGGIAVNVGRGISQAVSFKQSNMVGLKTFLGAGSGGVFEKMTAFAGRIGVAPEGLVETAKSLAMSGFPGANIERTVKRIADMNAIHAGSGDRVTGALANVFSSGIATGGDIEGLRGSGLNVERMFEDLSERLTGKRNRFVGKKLADANPQGFGKFNFAQILQGEIDRLNGNDPGSKALAAAQNPEAKTNNIFTQLKRMAGHLDKSSGLKALNGVLDNLTDLFNPSTTSGHKMVERLTQLSDVFAKFLAPLTGLDGKQRMMDFFTALAAGVEQVIPGMMTLANFTAKLAGLGLKSIQGFEAIGNLHLGDTVLFPPSDDSGLSREAHDRVQRQRRADAQRNGGMTINVNQHVDARGASKDDADHIARESKKAAVEAITDALERAAQHSGAKGQ